MALYDTRFGLPQSVADYLNQGLPDIYQNIDNTLPATIMPTEPAVQGPILEQLYPQNVSSGGDGAFNPYNTNLDSSNIRTQKNYVNPFPYDSMDDFGESNYGYIEEPRKGIPGLFDQYIKTSIPAQLIGGGVKGLLNMLPVNRTGIMQNELLGAGFALDNIGRIVAAPGKYNTPEGIMAGYNLAAREQDFDDPKNVFNKRTKKQIETLLDKYKGNITREQIQEVIDEIEETGEYTGDITDESIGAQNLFSNLVNTNKAKYIFKNKQTAADKIFNRKIEERKEKALEKQRQEQMAKEADTAARARAANAAVYKEASDRGFTNDRGGFSTSAADRAGTSVGSGQFSPSTSRGRSGY
jgi:hypothetical protein